MQLLEAKCSRRVRVRSSDSTHMLKSKIRKRENTCTERKKEIQGEKQPQKSANSFCNKDISSLPLGVQAVTGDSAFSFTCPVAAAPVTDATITKLGGALGSRFLELVCSDDLWV